MALSRGVDYIIAKSLIFRFSRLSRATSSKRVGIVHHVGADHQDSVCAHLFTFPSTPTHNQSIRFEKSRVIAPLHTSGPFTVSNDGSRLFTCVGEEAILTHVETGTEICRFKGVSYYFSSISLLF